MFKVFIFVEKTVVPALGNDVVIVVLMFSKTFKKLFFISKQLILLLLSDPFSLSLYPTTDQSLKTFFPVIYEFLEA
jgi:hypothetical protein